MGVLLQRANDALEINPPSGAQFLSVHGSNWLWAVTAVFTLSFVIFFGLTFVARSGEKIFHHLFLIALFVGSIAYFAMASDLGWTVVATANQIDRGNSRQIFFAKYVYWTVSWPVTILALGLLSGVAWTTIAYNITLSWVWVIAYLCGAYTETNYKWGFFAFGTVAYIFLAISTLLDGHRGAGRVGVSRDHALLAGWVNLLWLLYPIAWGLSDGGNRIGVTAGFIFFGILDILLIPVIAYATIGLSSKWDYGKLNLAFTQYGRVHAQSGTFPEKNTEAAGGPVTGEAAATAGA